MSEIIVASVGLALGIAFLIISIDPNNNKKNGAIFILLGLLQTLIYYTAAMLEENMVPRIIYGLASIVWTSSVAVNAIKLENKLEKLIDREKKDK